MRQTELSFEEIMYLLQDPAKSVFPSCLLVGEVGELAKTGDMRAARALIGFLEDKDPKCRFAACGWIGACGILAAIEPLRILLSKEKDEKVIDMAKEALRRLETVIKG